MAETYTRIVQQGERIFVGIDIHNKTWYVTIRTVDVELFKGNIDGNWLSLRKLLERYKGCEIETVYEAGYFGYWLHDHITEWGAKCIVTPPSLVPQEYGNHVKTDKRDSRKLALLLAKGMLKAVYVPSPQERSHRQVVRRRRQLITDRVRVQNRIKAELKFYGIELPNPSGKWSKTYLFNLGRIKFKNKWEQGSFNRLLEEYSYISELIDKQTQLIKELSVTDLYKERVKILLSIPGVGLLTAMEMLVELQDVARFRRADQLAAYVGLTPSQHSTSNHIRMGTITKAGKNHLRGTLIEASWMLIGKDKAMMKKYERIKSRSGAKRAIVAVARTLLIRARRILIDGSSYKVGVAA